MTPLIVIPTYNEKENIVMLINEVKRVLPKCYICIVDDNSPDGTAKEIMPLTKKHKSINLIKRTSKEGRGSAVVAGFKYGLKNIKIDYFIEMDADFSHNPSELKKILSFGEEYDAVLASRYLN